MRAIILAAGRGSRMGEMTENQPKCLARLKNKTLLQWQIEALRNAGIDNIGIVRGYKPDKINVEGLTFFENKEWHKTNMVMSLCCADKWLENYECIVSYSDIVYLAETIEELKKDSNDLSIIYNTNWLKLWEARFDNPLEDAENFKLNEKGKLKQIGGRANVIEEIQGQYMGLLKFTPNGWNKIKSILQSVNEEKKMKLDMTSLLNILLEEGVEISAVPSGGLWLEVDNENDLNLYKKWYE